LRHLLRYLLHLLRYLLRPAPKSLGGGRTARPATGNLLPATGNLWVYLLRPRDSRRLQGDPQIEAGAVVPLAEPDARHGRSQVTAEVGLVLGMDRVLFQAPSLVSLVKSVLGNLQFRSDIAALPQESPHGTGQVIQFLLDFPRRLWHYKVPVCP
jgi:hypothetical protein